MRIVATPQAVEWVRERGGQVFCWTMGMREGYGYTSVFVLEASTESPGADHEFLRFQGEGIVLLLDTGTHGTPESIHLAVVGRFRRKLRAYWNGRSYARGT